MKNTDVVYFYWTDKSGSLRSLKTTGEYFLSYAIELLEDECFDFCTGISYTHNNITRKIDYYNFPHKEY